MKAVHASLPTPGSGVVGVVPWVAWTLATALSLFAASSGQAQRVRADGIAAIVGAPTPRADATVILLSDVDLRARLRLAGQRTGAIHRGPIPMALRRATLDELLGEALIAGEAERVQLATPSERDLREERQRLRTLAGGEERFHAVVRALQVSEQELEATVRRRAIVNVFLEANLQGSTGVGDGELERVYASGEHPFIGQSLEEAREPMRVWLARRALDAAVRRWIEVLTQRTVVRVLVPWTQRQRGEDPT